MKRPVVIFANPIAGRGKAMAISELIRAELDRLRAYRVEHFSLPAETVDLDRLRSLGRLHAAISIGGDGTLQGVTELLLKLTAGGPVPPMLVVPLGTANLIARHLKLPWRRSRDVGQIAEALEARHLLQLDAARCNGKIFLAVAGIGFDAEVVHHLHRRRRGPITKGSYVLPAVQALRGYGFPRIDVEVDGYAVFAEAPGLAYVGNVREYGTGIPMLPHARSDDRLLDVCVLPCRNKSQAVKWMISAASQSHPEAEGAVYVRGKRIVIRSPMPVPIQLDGEAAGHTPAVIELLDHPLPFIVAP